jgi:glycosyltransferase involved in cell wall biosynthesis
MKLSVVMIAKNEEAMLPACLNSVKGADEIVVLDTGSTDRTVEIALAAGAVIGEYKWNDDFSAARNAALDISSGDWILSIDADETLNENGIEIIREFINSNPTALSVNIHLDNGHGETFLYPRLFKRGVRWVGEIHEVPNDYSEKPTVEVTITYGASPNHAVDPDIDLRILQKIVNGEKKTSPRTYYYLGREYYYRQKWEDALACLDLYLKFATWLPEKADAYLLSARCLWSIQRGDQARPMCLHAIEINANFKEALLLMAEMSWPENKERWESYAAIADNRDVLFVRS